MPEVMGRGQPFFPDEPGYTMPDRNETWSFLRDYHKTPGPAAHDPVHPNVRLLCSTYFRVWFVFFGLGLFSSGGKCNFDLLTYLS